MKVKFRYGIKAFSGTLDELNYANYSDRNVVIGRLLPQNRQLTEHNVQIGTRMTKIAEFYSGISDAFKQDLELYALKMYKLKEFRNRIAGNKYSTFVKMIYMASKDANAPVDIDSLSLDDLNLGSYSQIETVKDCVENGYLPKVDGYEELEASAR